VKSLKEVILEVLERADEELSKMQQNKIEEIFKEFSSSDFPLKVYPDPALFQIDFTLWYGLFYRNRETDKTIFEEVLQKFDKEALDKVKSMKIISGNFSIRGFQRINDRYYVKLYNSIGEFVVEVGKQEWETQQKIKNTHTIACHIMSYNGKYYLVGVVEYIPLVDENGLIMPTYVDKALEMVDSTKLKAIEDLNVTDKTTLKQCLSKYPAQWIDQICDTLNIKGRVKKEKIDAITEFYTKNLDKILEKLPEEAIEILRLILKEGGVVKYGKLSKKFLDDTSYFHHEPKTPLGILRFYCLVFVGKMNINGKNYKVAIIPSDLRDVLKKQLDFV